MNDFNRTVWRLRLIDAAMDSPWVIREFLPESGLFVLGSANGVTVKLSKDHLTVLAGRRSPDYEVFDYGIFLRFSYAMVMGADFVEDIEFTTPLD